jgi:hypothetical protein
VPDYADDAQAGISRPSWRAGFWHRTAPPLVLAQYGIDERTAMLELLSSSEAREGLMLPMCRCFSASLPCGS